MKMKDDSSTDERKVSLEKEDKDNHSLQSKEVRNEMQKIVILESLREKKVVTRTINLALLPGLLCFISVTENSEWLQ